MKVKHLSEQLEYLKKKIFETVDWCAPELIHERLEMYIDDFAEELENYLKARDESIRVLEEGEYHCEECGTDDPDRHFEDCSLALGPTNLELARKILDHDEDPIGTTALAHVVKYVVEHLDETEEANRSGINDILDRLWKLEHGND